MKPEEQWLGLTCSMWTITHKPIGPPPSLTPQIWHHIIPARRPEPAASHPRLTDALGFTINHCNINKKMTAFH
jgi:hypothetical protein